jgi:hypothetical protein
MLFKQAPNDHWMRGNEIGINICIPRKPGKKISFVAATCCYPPFTYPNKAMENGAFTNDLP